MSYSLSRPVDKIGESKKRRDGGSVATETDPLLLSQPVSSSGRARRRNSRSPVQQQQQQEKQQVKQKANPQQQQSLSKNERQMRRGRPGHGQNDDVDDYDAEDDGNAWEEYEFDYDRSRRLQQQQQQQQLHDGYETIEEATLHSRSLPSHQSVSHQSQSTNTGTTNTTTTTPSGGGVSSTGGGGSSIAAAPAIFLDDDTNGSSSLAYSLQTRGDSTTTTNTTNNTRSTNNTNSTFQQQQQQQKQQQQQQQHQQQKQQLPAQPLRPAMRDGQSAASYSNRTSSPTDNRSVGSSGSQPPLLEIPEEIYAVRKAALQVLKPLTKTWVVISVGFALTVLFGMARWTNLMPGLPFWFILLPCWSAHVGLLWLHILSAKALSSFIAEANESRQRPDSRDHLNRTEYLPLLQRSLKFGLKTGILSFFVFVFEILIFIRLARGTVSLAVAFTPLWLLVTGGILDGLICKSQHFIRVLCWILTFTGMLLLVLKVDYGYDSIRWRVVVSPIVAVLSIASATLIYIVYGHQVGYYRLTESQLSAGNLYSLAALICIILVVMIGEVIPLTRPVEVETRLLVVILAPLIVCLVGMGAWVVSRDEFGRLLLYGGQAAVHPMKLRWESKGWTSVQGKGVTIIPMFGEVSFRPLERKPTTTRSLSSHPALKWCSSVICYPYEEDDEAEFEDDSIIEDPEAAAATRGSSLGTDAAAPAAAVPFYHPYLDPSPRRGSSSHAARQSSYNVVRAAGVTGTV